MMPAASLFSQLLSFFDRPSFARLVTRHGTERHAKGFSSWTHFSAMLFCHLAQSQSLSEICGGLASAQGKLVHLGLSLAPKKSTLAYANQHRSFELFRDLFYLVLKKCQSDYPHPPKKFRFKNKLLSMDTTIFSLCLKLFPWAEYNRQKGGVKLHLLLDHAGYLPVFAVLDKARHHDHTRARHFPLAKGSIVAMDKGYHDYRLFAEWTKEGIYFVTPLKRNADLKVVEERPCPKNRNILADQTVRMASPYGRKRCPYLLRRVVVWDPKGEREIVLLTNHLQFGATTISAIYKDRWKIEIFFKELKQNLKVKTFVGTSQNAIYVQIWTALIALLLVKYLHLRSRFKWALSNLIAILRLNLFTYRDLWKWLDDPYARPPPPLRPQLDQKLLPGFGQLEAKMKW
jgi:hypothetical protein